MTPVVYAHALYAALRGGTASEAQLVQNLEQLLRDRGHAMLLPRILREYEKLAASKLVADRGVLEVARESDTRNLREEIGTAARELGVDLEEAEVVENDAVVGGFILRKTEAQVDASYRRRLLDLYQRLRSA